MRVDIGPQQGPLIAVSLVAGVTSGLVSPVPWVSGAAVALGLASLAMVPGLPAARKLLALAAVTAAAAGHGAAARERAVNPPVVQWLDRTAV
jgi:fatty acid desaturase